MNIFYYSKFSNQLRWISVIKKKFQDHNILTTKDNFDYKKIDIAIVWHIPNIVFILWDPLEMGVLLGFGGVKVGGTHL